MVPPTHLAINDTGSYALTGYFGFVLKIDCCLHYTTPRAMIQRRGKTSLCVVNNLGNRRI